MSLAALCAAGAALALSPAWRPLLCRPRHLPALPEKAHPTARISVIIPARNEEKNLAPLLKALQAQSAPAHEIIVVDDHSEDATAALAREHGARVLSAQALPSGWLGKPWACQQGAAQASGDWFLFLDADTRPAPDFLAKLSALTSAEDEVHSLAPYHRVQRPSEQLCAYFNLLMIIGANAFGAPNPDPPALFGQALFLSKTSHRKLAGHELVKDQVLENFHLAAHLPAHGLRARNWLGGADLSMRMFPGGHREQWASWQKGFLHGASGTSPRVLRLSALWLTGATFVTVAWPLTLLWPSAPALALTTLAHLIYAWQSARGFRLAGRFHPLTALLFPLPLLYYHALFFTALWKKKRGHTTAWKGRQV
ncbi:MAG: glycosyltransferase family 2 protein [Verrucomicrobiales bacterium]